MNDGAAAVVLMSQESAANKGISPLASIVAVAQVGIDPKIMGIGPVEAVKLVVSILHLFFIPIMLNVLIEEIYIYFS